MRDPMLPTLYSVAQRTRESHDTHTLVLEPLGPTRIADFAPGQFTMLYTFGRGEVPISISGPSGPHAPLVHTIKEVGAVSRGLCALEVGAHVGVRGPFGTAWPLDTERGRDLVLIAGGIGLAPLRPALLHALDHRNDFGRIAVLIGARTPADVLYAAEYDAWRQKGAEVHVTVDAVPTPGWRGNIGVVTALLPRLRLDGAFTTGFMCGPEVMMRFAAHALQQAGVPPHHIVLTMERNMKCAIGFCGHCQLGADFVCRQGPVFRFSQVRDRIFAREL